MDPGRDYVSRGGVKLANALDALAIDVTGRDCVDVGASTGGFTDCLLQRGASRVIALDVAHGQLDWNLRQDARVHVIERTNAREINPGDLPFEPSLATVDLSFISLVKVLPAVAGSLAAEAELLAMVKPQFELGQKRVRGGVVRDAADRREALLAVAEAAAELGLAVRGFASSGLPGPKGNRETFLWAGASGVGLNEAEIEVATRYAQERRQFGKRIGDLQMVGAMLADMDAATESARQLLYKACAEIDAVRRTAVDGRRCVNSLRVTPPCGSRPTPSRCSADMATSTSSPSSG